MTLMTSLIGAHVVYVFQSIAVNSSDAAATGGASSVVGSAATSVTVITSSGVISYQQSGSIPVGRAAGWAVNFDRLLRDRAGLATFTVRVCMRVCV